MEILLLVYNDKDKLLRVVIVLTIINMALQIFFYYLYYVNKKFGK